MSLVISHYSALEILRSANSPVIPEHYSSASLSSRLPSHAERKELWIEVAHTYECKLRPPISILMSSSSPTYHPKGIYIHRSRESFNSKCFLQLFEDIYCTSPLYLPFQMSSILSEIELTLLICELLGTYSYRSTGVLLSKKEPLITKEQLREFLETMKGKRCYRKVHNAFLYACEMSASPMESKLYLRFTYPWHKGGYNLKNILLNPEIYLKQLDATNNKVRVRKPDLLVSNPLLHNDSQHPVKAVAIEYNGDYHDSLEQQHLDCIRYNELLSHGIKIMRLIDLPSKALTCLTIFTKQYEKTCNSPALISQRVTNKSTVIVASIWSNPLWHAIASLCHESSIQRLAQMSSTPHEPHPSESYFA